MSLEDVEQRLVDALRATEPVRPSDDLWARVLHSIDEDRAHRRRVRRAIVAGTTAVVGLAVVMLLGLTDGPLGRQVRPPDMELVETIALVTLVAVLGRSIARFGRGYATDLWAATPHTAGILVRLLDVAHSLVFAGYILLTVEFDWRRSTVVPTPSSFARRIPTWVSRPPIPWRPGWARCVIRIRGPRTRRSSGAGRS